MDNWEFDAVDRNEVMQVVIAKDRRSGEDVGVQGYRDIAQLVHVLSAEVTEEEAPGERVA